MAKWTNERTRFFLELISSAISSGKACSKGNFKTKNGWKQVQTAMEEKFNSGEFSIQCLKNKLQILKKSHRTYEKVIGLSGAGSSTDSRLDESAWKELIASHPDCAQWKIGEFEFHQQMNETFQGTFATGNNALSVKNIAENGLPDSGESASEEHHDSPPPPKNRKPQSTLNVLGELSKSFQTIAESFSAKNQDGDSLVARALESHGLAGENFAKALDAIAVPGIAPIFVKLTHDAQVEYLRGKGVVFE